MQKTGCRERADYNLLAHRGLKGLCLVTLIRGISISVGGLETGLGLETSLLCLGLGLEPSGLGLDVGLEPSGLGFFSRDQHETSN